MKKLFCVLCILFPIVFILSCKQITETTEEIKPVLYFDEETNEVKGKCKLKPYKKYFAFEIREKK